MALRVLPTRAKYLRAVRANAGVEAWYRKHLRRLIAGMAAQTEGTVARIYRRGIPQIALLASDDATLAEQLTEALGQIRREWVTRFDELSRTLARGFAERASGTTDAGIAAAMRDVGFGIRFDYTPAIRDVMAAEVAENVALIRTIPAQYFAQIEGAVMRSVQRGADQGALAAELKVHYAITDRRAALIARDQNAKATAVVTRVRHQEAGLTEAEWMHSHAGRHPRPSHVKADGERYEIAKGKQIEGEWIWPGQKINCRCYARAVLPIP